jgi:competence protein ComEA
MRAVLQIGLLLFLPAAVAALEVNTATRAQLERPADLGVATTDRILRAREERPFADWDNLAVRVSELRGRRAQQLDRRGLRVNGKAPPAATVKPK